MRTNPKHKKSKRIIISTETGRMNCYPPESCDPIHPASLIASLMLIDSSCCCATTAAAAASLLALLLSPLPVVLPTGGNNFPPASLCAAKTSASNPCSTRSPEGGGLGNKQEETVRGRFVCVSVQACKQRECERVSTLLV